MYPYQRPLWARITRTAGRTLMFMILLAACVATIANVGYSGSVWVEHGYIPVWPAFNAIVGALFIAVLGAVLLETLE